MFPRKFFLVCVVLLAISGACSLWTGLQKNSDCCDKENSVRTRLCFLGITQIVLAIVNCVLSDISYLRSIKQDGAIGLALSIILTIVSNIFAGVAGIAILFDSSYDSCKEDCGNLFTIYHIVIGYELFFGLLTTVLALLPEGKRKKTQ